MCGTLSQCFPWNLMYILRFCSRSTQGSVRVQGSARGKCCLGFWRRKPGEIPARAALLEPAQCGPAAFNPPWAELKSHCYPSVGWANTFTQNLYFTGDQSRIFLPVPEPLPALSCLSSSQQLAWISAHFSLAHQRWCFGTTPLVRSVKCQWF